MARGFRSFLELFRPLVLEFLRDVRPDLAGVDRLRGYFHFLRWQKYLCADCEMRITHQIARRNFPGPEVFSRNARELAGLGQIKMSQQERLSLERQANEMQEYYR